MSGIHDWRFPCAKKKGKILWFPNSKKRKLTVLCGPDDCSSRMRINISRALAFWRTSSNVAFMDKCLTAFNIWTRHSGSRSSQARNSPTHCKSEDGMNIENQKKSLRRTTFLVPKAFRTWISDCETCEKTSRIWITFIFVSIVVIPRIAITFNRAAERGSRRPSRMNIRQKSFLVVGLWSSKTLPMPFRACSTSSVCSP